MLIQEEVLMTCEVREKKFKAVNREINVEINAFRTGRVKVVLVAYSVHMRLTMDFVTATEKLGKLRKKNRNVLNKLAFFFKCSRASGREKIETNNPFLRCSDRCQ